MFGTNSHLVYLFIVSIRYRLNCNASFFVYNYVSLSVLYINIQSYTDDYRYILIFLYLFTPIDYMYYSTVAYPIDYDGIDHFG